MDEMKWVLQDAMVKFNPNEWFNLKEAIYIMLKSDFNDALHTMAGYQKGILTGKSEKRLIIRSISFFFPNIDLAFAE